MAVWFDEHDHETIAAASDRVIPGARAAGVADYLDRFLGAFTFDSPRIWAGGPFSGRHGGEPSFDQWLTLRAIDELAWRIRLEGSNGDPAREINGPVVGLQERYRDGLEALGPDFADVPVDEQDRRLDAMPAFKALLYAHCCEGMYGDPVYGGNQHLVGWQTIDFPGDAQPRGYTDEEVSGAG